jgi:hypothetical protein
LSMLSIHTSDCKHRGLQKWLSLAQPHAMLVVTIERLETHTLQSDLMTTMVIPVSLLCNLH